MRGRRRIAAAAALVVLSADLVDSAVTRTAYFHPRPLWLLAGGAAAAAALLVLAPRVPSLALSVGAGIAAGGAVGTLVAALVWSRGVPDPLVQRHCRVQPRRRGDRGRECAPSRFGPARRVAESRRASPADLIRSRRRLGAAGRRRKLSARRLDVAAARQPHGRRHTRAIELGLERGDPLARRAFVQPGRVVRDQVHLEVVAAEQLRERARLLGRVVDAGEHHVLDEDAAPRRLRVAAALGDDVRERVAVVDRHDPRPQLVGRRRAARARAGSARRPRRRSAAGPGSQPTVEIVVRRCVMPRSGSRRARGEHLVEVQHRLAHAHEDGMVDRLEPPEVERLVEDLRRGQIAPERHRAGRAERARERAARLRREAERAAAVPVAHQHRLDRMPVVRCGRASSPCRRATRCSRLDASASRTARSPRALAQRDAGGSSSRRSRRRRAPPTPTPAAAR